MGKDLDLWEVLMLTGAFLALIGALCANGGYGLIGGLLMAFGGTLGWLLLLLRIH